eukprot:ctg_544.g316
MPARATFAVRSSVQSVRHACRPVPRERTEALRRTGGRQNAHRQYTRLCPILPHGHLQPIAPFVGVAAAAELLCGVGHGGGRFGDPGGPAVRLRGDRVLLFGCDAAVLPLGHIRVGRRHGGVLGAVRGAGNVRGRMAVARADEGGGASRQRFGAMPLHRFCGVHNGGVVQWLRRRHLVYDRHCGHAMELHRAGGVCAAPGADRTVVRGPSSRAPCPRVCADGPAASAARVQIGHDDDGGGGTTAVVRSLPSALVSPYSLQEQLDRGQSCGISRGCWSCTAVCSSVATTLFAAQRASRNSLPDISRERHRLQAGYCWTRPARNGAAFMETIAPLSNWSWWACKWTLSRRCRRYSTYHVTARLSPSRNATHAHATHSLHPTAQCSAPFYLAINARLRPLPVLGARVPRFAGPPFAHTQTPTPLCAETRNTSLRGIADGCSSAGYRGIGYRYGGVPFVGRSAHLIPVCGAAERRGATARAGGQHPGAGVVLSVRHRDERRRERHRHHQQLQPQRAARPGLDLLRSHCRHGGVCPRGQLGRRGEARRFPRRRRRTGGHQSKAGADGGYMIPAEAATDKHRRL